MDCARTSLRSACDAFLSRLLRGSAVGRHHPEAGAGHDRDADWLVARGFLRSAQRSRSTPRSGVVGCHVSILSPNGGNRRAAVDRSHAVPARRGIRIGSAAFFPKGNVEVGDVAQKSVGALFSGHPESRRRRGTSQLQFASVGAATRRLTSRFLSRRDCERWRSLAVCAARDDTHFSHRVPAEPSREASNSIRPAPLRAASAHVAHVKHAASPNRHR